MICAKMQIFGVNISSHMNSTNNIKNITINIRYIKNFHFHCSYKKSAYYDIWNKQLDIKKEVINYEYKMCRNKYYRIEKCRWTNKKKSEYSHLYHLVKFSKLCIGNN